MKNASGHHWYAAITGRQTSTATNIRTNRGNGVAVFKGSPIQ